MHDIDQSNIVNGRPICYLVNLTNLVIDPLTYGEHQKRDVIDDKYFIQIT